MSDWKLISRKDSLNALFGHSDIPKPQLAVFYENAHREIYGCRVFVGEGKYIKFIHMSDDLKCLGINDRDYAYSIIKILGSWLKRKNLTHVPINTFCGDWCLNKFLSIHRSETVAINTVYEDREQELLHSELTIARYYISKNLSGVLRFGDAVNDIRGLLSKSWIALYEQKNIPNKFRYMAVDILADEFCIGIAKDYNDIIGKLRCRA